MVVQQRKPDRIVQSNAVLSAGEAAACAGGFAGAGAGLCWPAANGGLTINAKAKKLRCFKGGLLVRPRTQGTDLTGFSFQGVGAVYRDDGGPRGAMPCGTTSGSAITTPNSSNRLTAGAISMAGVAATIADPPAEQIGQTCESNDCEFNSTQQCNCAPINRLARIVASSRALVEIFGILRGFLIVLYYTGPAPKRHLAANCRNVRQTPIYKATNSKALAILFH